MSDLERKAFLLRESAKNSIAKEDEDEVPDYGLGHEENTKLKEFLDSQSRHYNNKTRKDLEVDDDRLPMVDQQGSDEEKIDSDVEFDSIVEIETIFREFRENTFEEQELHEKIVKMFEKISNLVMLFEFGSKDVTFVFDNIVAKELQYFSSMETVAKITKDASSVQLPYRSFWKSLSNLVLMKYHEMEFYHIIQILYHLMNAGYTELTLDMAYLNKDQLARLQKINKYAQYQLMIEYLKDQIENVIDVEIALHEDYLNLQMLYILCKNNIKDLIPKDKLDEKIQQFNEVMVEQSQGLTYMLNEYNLQQVLEYFELIPDNLITKAQFEILVVILLEGLKKSRFNRCKPPTYQDVTRLMRKLDKLVKSNTEIDQECLDRYNKVIRVILQKAITTKGEQYLDQQEISPQNQKDETQIVRRDINIKDELEFLQLLKAQNESAIFDMDTCKLIVFELSQQVLKPAPFDSQEEAQIRLALMLYALKNYKIEKAKEKQANYISTFQTQLSKQLFENKDFDKYLDYEEYAILRDIAVELEKILGRSEESQKMIQNLERRVYNYTKLHTF